MSRKVDLVRVLERAFGVKSYAAINLISHGHVSIDGHVVPMIYARNHWTEDQLYGRMMRVAQRGEHRLFGSRLVRDMEQMTLG